MRDWWWILLPHNQEDEVIGQASELLIVYSPAGRAATDSCEGVIKHQTPLSQFVNVWGLAYSITICSTLEPYIISWIVQTHINQELSISLMAAKLQLSIFFSMTLNQAIENLYSRKTAEHYSFHIHPNFCFAPKQSNP